MSIHPTAESICERLKQAQKETLVILTIEGRPNIVEMNETSPPESCWEGMRSMDRYMDNGTWQTKGPGFRRLQEWVEVHWSPEDEKQAPIGTVATGEGWGRQGEVQLDSASATRKLIAAAKLYGPEQIGKHAAEFAAHGMIEVSRIYLLKGPPIGAAMPLDEYCSLLPYCEAWRRVDAELDLGDSIIAWPEPPADNVCAFEGRYFEHGGLQTDEHGQYTSPLLKDGPEQLALLLGLVWGNGFRVFGRCHGVPATAVAALPYRRTTWERGAGSGRVTLALQGYGPRLQKRPLAVTELHDLATKYWELPVQVRRRLGPAMARLRNSTERIDEKDRVIDVGIALETIFMEEDEQEDQATLIPRRAAWHYADSEDEKQRTEDMLGRFYGHHSELVHGRASKDPGVGDHERNAKLLVDAENVLRACLKTIIAEGWPEDWNESTKRSALRLDPPRAESEIPSVKSDSLSWSVEEQRGIDQALEAVWKAVVEGAPAPPPDVSPSIVTGLTPELVESYREQGIPYVIAHPARLYMAHPKWPKTASGPLDERARYYCERDVERHTWQWRETAAGKGLLLFEVPTDADMYHPKCRDDWPLPLLSSHEMDPSVRIASQRPATGETEASHGSTAAADTEHRQRSATEEKPAAPSPELPKSTVSGLEKERSRLWTAFRYDVNMATNSLLHMLRGIHAIHLVERQRLVLARDASDDTAKTLEDAVRIWGDANLIPTYPRLRAFPLLTGDPLFGRTAPDGPMEQIVFRGWVSEVYDRWESHYRTQLKHETRDLPGAIRPRQQVLGDLRHIRNNLLHNGIARRGEAASCEVLRWFTKGERIQVRMRHVFDFLNQMGWLTEGPSVSLEEGEKTSGWYIDREGEPEEPTPALISVRPLFEPEEPDSRYRYGASVVFENGVFGVTPIELQVKDSTHKWMKMTVDERRDLWMKMTVDERGDLYVPSFRTIAAVDLYRSYLKGEKRTGPGIWQPPVRFRE